MGKEAANCTAVFLRQGKHSETAKAGPPEGAAQLSSVLLKVSKLRKRKKQDLDIWLSWPQPFLLNGCQGKKK